MLKNIVVILLVLICFEINAQTNSEISQISKFKLTLNQKIPSTFNYYYAGTDNVRQHHSFWNITGQVFSGAAISIVFTTPVMWLGIAATWKGKQTDFENASVSAIIISSYLFSTALGVYWVAKTQNLSISLWSIAGYSLIGGAIATTTIGIISFYHQRFPGEGGVVFLFPLISSIIYTTCIAEWPQQKAVTQYFHKTSLKHQDLINSSKIIDLPILDLSL